MWNYSNIFSKYGGSDFLFNGVRHKRTVLFEPRGVNYYGASTSVQQQVRHQISEHESQRNHQILKLPWAHPPSHPTTSCTTSTNAQWSWTTLIWGIILYETDGWGQPLTERVKTTLRCPPWISMMENRLLKKIYVCSPLPRENSTPSCPLPPYTPPGTHIPANQTCHCSERETQ